MYSDLDSKLVFSHATSLPSTSDWKQAGSLLQQTYPGMCLFPTVVPVPAAAAAGVGAAVWIVVENLAGIDNTSCSCRASASVSTLIEKQHNSDWEIPNQIPLEA